MIEKYRIVLVDDEQVDCIIFNKILEVVGVANVTSFQSAKLCLDYLEALNPAHWPTHIFIDLNMPYLDGFEFLKKYDKFDSKDNKNADLFILSSSNNPEDIRKAKGYKHVKEYLMKPFSIESAYSIFAEQSIRS